MHTSSPEHQRYLDLSARDADLLPGRALNTIVYIDNDGVRTALEPEAAVRLSRQLESQPENDWFALYLRSEDGELEAAAARQTAQMYLVKEAVRQALSPNDHSEDLIRHEQELFSYIDKDMYALAVARKINQLSGLDLAGKPLLEQERAQLIREYKGLVPEHSEINETGPVLLPETITAVKAWLEEQFEDVFELIDTDIDRYGDEEMKHFFDMCIETTPALRENGWLCRVVEREKRSLSVYANDRQVVVAKGMSVTPERLKVLAVHEVFGHALRSGIAETNGDVIGSVGTAQYARFEESLMIVLEQCLRGSVQPLRGVDHYLAIGAATGLCAAPKSRIELYGMFERMHRLILTSKGVHTEEKIAETAAKQAKAQMNRTFTGMTDTRPGAAHMKDIDYFHGLNQAAELLNGMVAAGELDAGMRWLLSGKFNPNERSRPA